jgi:hypothetical protein
MEASRRFKYLHGGFCTLILDKAKPFVRRGRKAVGLFKEEDDRSAEG